MSEIEIVDGTVLIDGDYVQWPYKVYPIAGFRVVFENQWTLSVVWHAGAYCANRDFETNIFEAGAEGISSTNVEILPFGPTEDSKSLEPAGWIPVERIGEYVKFVAALPSTPSQADFQRVQEFLNVR